MFGCLAEAHTEQGHHQAGWQAEVHHVECWLLYVQTGVYCLHVSQSYYHHCPPPLHDTAGNNRDLHGGTAGTRLTVKMAPVNFSPLHSRLHSPSALINISFCSSLEEKKNNHRERGGGQLSLHINIFLSNKMTRPLTTYSPQTSYNILRYLAISLHNIHTEPTQYLSANKNISLFQVRY